MKTQRRTKTLVRRCDRQGASGMSTSFGSFCLRQDRRYAVIFLVG